MRILVTGATGSFGKHFMHIMRDQGHELFGLSRDEFKQARLMRTMPWVKWILADVRYLSELPTVDVIVHAAAMKHVNRAETLPHEACHTNIQGTMNVLRKAREMGASVVALSTDKACEPINAYGATKFLLEKLVLAHGHNVVRYGNVIGSRGSLIPMLLEAEEFGLTVTVTDAEATRFWLTLDQAVEMVRLAIDRPRLNAIVVPHPKAMTVGELVKALAPSCQTNVIGLQQGEKMHETMYTSQEAARLETLTPEYSAITNRVTSSDAKPAYSSEKAPKIKRSELIRILEQYQLEDGELERCWE